MSFSKVEFDDDYIYSKNPFKKPIRKAKCEEGNELSHSMMVGATGGGLKDNLMQHLTNLRFRFNDGDFIKHMAYPEVNVAINGPV